METHLRHVSITCFFLTVIVVCLFKIEALDFGWHLKTGEYIWATKSIPTHDLFSYLAEGRRWVDSHWLFQLVLYAAYAIGAMPGVVLMRVTLVVVTFVLLISTSYRKEYVPVAIGVCLLALFASHQRFMIRPELVSLLFLAAFFYCVERFSKRPRLFLVVVPLCQAIWANMHGLHVLGVAFLGLYLLGDSIQLVCGRRLPVLACSETTARNLRQKGVLFVLVLLALLVNANGIDGILYPYKIYSELRGEISHFPMLGELRSPFSVSQAFPHPVVIYKVFLVVSVLGCLGNLKRIRFAHLLPFAAFLYLSTLALRNMALFAIVATPITIRNLSDLLEALRRWKHPAFVYRRYVPVATASLMVAFTAWIMATATTSELYDKMQLKRKFGIGVSEYFPEEFVERLRVVEGNFFNSPDLGGYLTWRIYPAKQIAMDGRWEVYGESLPRLLSAYRNPAAFARLAQKYDISAVVLGETQPAVAMARWLRRDPGWELTKRTRNCLLFERSNH